MKNVLGILLLLLLIGAPVLAQTQRMAPDDQDRFNGYYSRWVQDKQTNNRDDMLNMEQRMQDLMAKYGIASNTPYDELASQLGYRDDDRTRGYAGSWQGQMSPDDQNKFNKEYKEWLEERREGDLKGIAKHEGKMQEIMARYNIPPNTPFDVIATTNGYSPHYDYRQFQGRLSPEDQEKFNKEYEHWINDRRKNDRDDIAKHEGKMQEIMSRYDIPRDVPYDLIASSMRGY
jgi:hypothetical protein